MVAGVTKASPPRRPGPGQRVVVAMSGGVDSSVAAALLQDQGLEVLGVTFRLCERADAEKGRSCCGTDAAAAARAAAGVLGIPHDVIDGRELFRERVLRPAWQEYARGRTPNPCVHCNRRVKLELLLEHARRLGAGWIATGHHARIQLDEADQDQPALLRGRDAAKDQSYFLFALSAEQLGRTMMPVGELTKEQVKEQARQRRLPNAGRPESQDACLGAGPEGFAEALRRCFGARARPGELVDRGGRVLGHHSGVHLFTVGQRRGLGLALGRRIYVLSIDGETGRVVLGTDKRDLAAGGLRAGGVRWLAPEPVAVPLQAQVQVRYRHAPVLARIEPDGQGSVHLRFAEPQRAVTPGQAAVFYARERVLGGGWIDQVEAP